MITSATISALDIVENGLLMRQQLSANAKYFRSKMQDAGFVLAGADHPIIPVMIGDAKIASQMAEKLLEMGVYVVGFSFPVVPIDKARIRTQMNAELTIEQLDKVIKAFITVGKEFKVV